MNINIPAVSVSELHLRLGSSVPLKYPKASLKKALTAWRMEDDDAPIFRYLYRAFQPRRHLEFGTWQGAGALYCLEESNATVWTLNLPFGEERREPGFAYSNFPHEVKELTRWAQKIGMPVKKDFYHSDCIGFIGRLYLDKNLGHRVCQIYCDSTKWDTSQYPKSFFDSVLIDGGHTSDIVISDTKKALSLLREGGLIMWHDFCPDKDVRNNCKTARNVVKTIEDNWEWISAEMKDIFWINPSWILCGIKK